MNSNELVNHDPLPDKVQDLRNVSQPIVSDIVKLKVCLKSTNQIPRVQGTIQYCHDNLMEQCIGEVVQVMGSLVGTTFGFY